MLVIAGPLIHLKNMREPFRSGSVIPLQVMIKNLEKSITLAEEWLDLTMRELDV